MKIPNRKLTQGYSLVEALVATGILALGVAAAASMSLTLSQQEELNHQVARALAWHESAGRLHLLGLSEDEIEAIMPPLETAQTFTLTASTESLVGLGDVEVTTSELTFKPSSRTNDTRTHTLTLFPSNSPGS